MSVDAGLVVKTDIAFALIDVDALQKLVAEDKTDVTVDVFAVSAVGREVVTLRTGSDSLGYLRHMYDID